ncbi:MAG: transglycosylase SLT domain-containing protein [Methylococcaceae bacterium]
MRLLALSLNIFINASLLIYSVNVVASNTDNESSRFEFQQESAQRTKAVSSKLKRSHTPSNIWDRIRLGMQIPRPNPPITIWSDTLLSNKTDNTMLNNDYKNSKAISSPSNTLEKVMTDSRIHSHLPIHQDEKELARINSIIEAASKHTLPATGLMVADNGNSVIEQTVAIPLTLEQQDALKKQQLEKQKQEKQRLEKEAAIHERVNKHIIKYTQNKNYLYAVAERAKPYLYHIVNGLSQYQLPFELALLPIVESAYQPTAQSPKSAAGLWQFIPSTGLDFDLKQTENYDDRLDITASTQAAMRYLSFLKRHFKGDWLLALAAYNCGLGMVDEAIKKNTIAGLATDYWSLDLPAETQDYVPRLLALSSIFAEPARYNLKFAPIRNEPYFIQVRIDRQSDVQYLATKSFSEIAELANLSYEQFNRLNPGYLQASLASAEPATFLMPAVNANLLQKRLTAITKFVDADKTIHLNTPSKSRAVNELKPEFSLYATMTVSTPTKLVNLSSPFITLNVSANKTTPRIVQQPLVNASLSLVNSFGV